MHLAVTGSPTIVPNGPGSLVPRAIDGRTHQLLTLLYDCRLFLPMTSSNGAHPQGDGPCGIFAPPKFDGHAGVLSNCINGSTSGALSPALYGLLGSGLPPLFWASTERPNTRSANETRDLIVGASER
jgi:hypothetical protein